MSSSPDDELVFRKVSEHGLGHLVSPYGPGDRTRRWIQEGRRCSMEPELPQPWWYVLPAVSSTAVSSPLILHAFDGYNRQRTPELQIRPFNFVLSAHVAEFGHPEGVDPTRFT